MPLYYNNGTVSRWYMPTSATAATNCNWINWATNGTAATTITTAITPTIYWYVADDWSNDNTYTPVRIMTPQRVLARPYIARRSAVLAAEDELRYYYEQEQRSQAATIRHQHAAAARERSRELLLAHLTSAQRETFAKNKWFIVEGGLSKQRYRIRDTGHMVANIDVLGEVSDIVSHRLCGHCDLNEVPLYDQLLAQKMMLELDEERFLKIANRHRVVA
ncbi:hypothetical protein [Bradyrhizobium sp. 150]|uniref:hypothetical protein n=1 Tax=Bradyrhizobium sp. 150 TaxID=2782625 RepID=UPI001FF7EF05|nr:hypothetical protein [Bradyrhizobium sp. 150]MCK1670339.1 hypothetical protein [Bradyrhizobium sp. 150]